jgi:hypothetical protein
MQLGIRLVDYKMMAPLGRKRVPTQTIGVQAMQDYLKAHKARLLKTEA